MWAREFVVSGFVKQDQVPKLVLNFAFGSLLIFGLTIRCLHWIVVFLGQLSGIFFLFVVLGWLALRYIVQQFWEPFLQHLLNYSLASPHSQNYTTGVTAQELAIAKLEESRSAIFNS